MKQNTEWEWREVSDLASLFAAPVWVVVWVLTLGRFGQPLFRVVVSEISPRPSPPTPEQKPRFLPRRRGDGYQPTEGAGPDNPPQGGSGISPPPVTPCLGLMEWDGRGGIQVREPGGIVRTYVSGPDGELTEVTSLGDQVSP